MPKFCSIRLVLAGLASLVLSLAVDRPAAAQAWVPPAHTGSVTFVVQRIANTGHRIFDGTLIPDGKSTDVGAQVELDYAFTDRFSASASIPYIFTRYLGPGGAPPGIPFQAVDACFCWQSGWQDFGFAARYNLVNTRRFALTPSLAAGIPSHDYAYQGEAVVGHRLKEVRAAVDAGLRLDPISPRVSLQAGYSYAVVERILDVPNNRSNASIEGGFAFTRRFSARGLVQWQHTHGGLRFPMDVVPFPDRVAEHDRLLRDNNVRIGGGAACEWRGLDLFGTYVAFVSGVNTHAGHAITIGVSRSFER